jgi:polar amino acid transport system substrate-binding protein
MTGFVAADPRYRLLDGRFMQIRQAVGTTRTRETSTVRFLSAAVEELRANGFVAAALRRANQPDTLVAPPEPGEGSATAGT